MLPGSSSIPHRLCGQQGPLYDWGQGNCLLPSPPLPPNTHFAQVGQATQPLFLPPCIQYRQPSTPPTSLHPQGQRQEAKTRRGKESTETSYCSTGGYHGQTGAHKPRVKLFKGHQLDSPELPYTHAHAHTSRHTRCLSNDLQKAFIFNLFFKE